MRDRLVTSAFFLTAGLMIGGGLALLLQTQSAGWWLVASSALPIWRGFVWTQRDERASPTRRDGE